MIDVSEAMNRRNFGKPSAAKRGRRAEWPFVPVIDYGKQTDTNQTKTMQVRGKAFKTRDEAIEHASKSIAAMRERFQAMLLDPRERALREQYGLPREIQR